MGKRIKVLLVLGVVLCLGLFALTVAGCSSQETETAGDNTGQDQEELGVIEMGAIYSLSGAGSVIGNMQKNAVTFAINQANEQGGVEINGKRYLFEGIFRDDESKPDVGARRLRELANDGIEVFQGGTMANVSLAMSEASKQQGSFYMSSCAVPSPYFEKNSKAPYSMGILGNAMSVGRAGATYMMNEYNPKKVVFFLPDYAWGQQHELGARQIMEQYPDVQFDVVYSPVGTADLTPYIIQVRDMDPDVVVIGHWGNDAITSLKQSFEMGLRDDTEVMFIWTISVFAKAVEAASIDGMKALTFWHHDMEGLDNPDIVASSQELVDEWERAIGEPPDAYAMAAWLGVKETIRGIELAQSTDPEQVYNALMENPEFDTPKGPAVWRIDGTPAYENYAFILEGTGADERKDPDWDFGKVVGVFEGDEFLVPLEELGW